MSTPHDHQPDGRARLWRLPTPAYRLLLIAPPLALAGVILLQWIFLGLAAFFLMLGHPAPFGTLAFGSLLIAALIHERQASRTPGRAPSPTSRPALTE